MTILSSQHHCKLIASCMTSMNALFKVCVSFIYTQFKVIQPFTPLHWSCHGSISISISQHSFSYKGQTNKTITFWLSQISIWFMSNKIGIYLTLPTTILCCFEQFNFPFGRAEVGAEITGSRVLCIAHWVLRYKALHILLYAWKHSALIMQWVLCQLIKRWWQTGYIEKFIVTKTTSDQSIFWL